MQEPKKELTEEQPKPLLKEETTDTLDLEKKEIKITTRKILRKTNIIKYGFKNNSVCLDTQLNIISPKLKEKDNVINKIKSFSLNKTDKLIKLHDKEKSKINNLDLLKINKNEDLIIKNYKTKKLGDNIINKVNNIQLFNAKLQKPDKNITGYTFGDTQLSHDKLQKTDEELTDENIPISKIGKEMDKSASYDNNLAKGDLDKKENEEEQKLYIKRKAINPKVQKSNKKKKLKTLVIDIDNKYDLKNSFNKWNDLTPNLDKNKSLNIKQVRYPDKSSMENVDEDINNINDTNKNNIESSSNINDNDDENIQDLNKTKPLKIKHIKRNIFIETNDKKLIDKEEDLKDNKTPSAHTSDKERSSYLNTNSSNENEINTNNRKSGSTISIEIEDKDKDKERNSLDQKVIELEKPEEPKKREIIINKKICIISKKTKKKKYDDLIKKKFLEKRFLIRFWKIWKKKNELEKEKEEEIEREKQEIKSLNQKSTKKPFILKINRVSIKKKVLELPKTKIIRQKREVQEKIIFLENKINKINEIMIKRHFFYKWKNEINIESNIVLGINSLHIILKRYIVRYLIMHAKILKFRTLLIKYALFNRK